MVNQQDGNMMPVRKLFEKSDILIIICVQIAVTACSADTLLCIDHNKLCGRMLCQKLFDLLFQPMLERVRHDREVQRRRCVFRQVKEPHLNTLQRIFEAEIQDLALRCCKIPERLPLRDA